MSEQQASAPTPTPARTRTIAKWGGLVLAGLLAILLLAFAYLQTSPGLAMLERGIESLARSPELEIDLVGLSGRFPDRLRLDQITVSDATGQWLTASDIALTWQPLRLFGGLLHVEQITAADLTVMRLPTSAQPPPKQDPAPLAVPRLPFALRIDALGVDTIELAAPVIGTPVGLRLAGSLSAESEAAINSDLTLERTDGPLGSLAVSSAFSLSERTLAIDAVARESAGGLIARVLGIPELPEFELTVTGDGPVSDWRGRIAGRSGDAASIDAQVTVAAGDTVAFAVEGNTEIAAFVPPAYRDFVQPAVKISVSGDWNEPSAQVHLAKLNLASNAIDIEGAGRLDVEASTLEATASASIAGAPLSPLMGPAALKGLDLELELAGPLTAPDARFTATARDFALDPVSAGSVSIVGALTATGAGGAAAPVLGVAATIETTDFASSAATVAQMLGTAPRAFIAADIDLARGLVTANDVRLTGEALAVSVAGTAAMGGATADLVVEARVDDLARVPAGASVALQGSGHFKADIKVAENNIAATIDGRATEFASGVAVLDKLIGGQLDLSAKIAGAPAGAWRVDEIALKAKNAAVSGDVRLSPDLETIEANYSAAVPELAPLAAQLGADISGRITSRGAVTGSLEALAFSGSIDAAKLSVAGQVIPRASLLLEVQNLTDRPRGTFALDAKIAEAVATARGGFALEQDGLALSALEAEGAGIRAAGDLKVPTGEGAIAGTVRVDIVDLGRLAGMFGQAASGQARADIAFGRTDGEATVQATLQANELRLERDDQSFGATAANGEVTVAYKRADPGFKGALDASGVTAATATLSSLRLVAEGTAQEIAFTAAAKGDIKGETDLDVAGALSFPEGATVISLAKLDGRLAGQPIALLSPARLQLGANRFSLDPLRLEFAGGGLTAQGELTESAVTGNVVVQGMPTALMAAGGFDLPISGAIDGELRLQGAPARPEVSLSATGRELQLQIDPQTPPVAVDLALTASLRDQQLTFEANGGGGEFFSLSSQGRAPVNFSLSPFVFAEAADGAVAGELRFTGNVALVERIVPIDPHRIRGNVQATVNVAGTTAQPAVTGNATLTNGVYENLEFGTFFRSVDGTVEFVDQRAQVRLTALDGDSGRIDLTGQVALAEPRSLDLALRMDNVTLVRRDDVEAALSGDIAAAGALEDLLISGEIETNTIEVRLIDSLPPGIVSLEVEEVGQRRSGIAAPPPDEKDPFVARLQIGVTIPNQLFVRGRGLDSEWKGEISVLGTTADPNVSGSLSPVRGQYSFAGKTFKLTGGVIEIDERDGALAAILNVKTEFTNNGFVARVNVVGPATKPEIELSSTPELPRDEVLARILFGRGTGQLSAIEALQLAEAAATLSGAIGTSTGVLDKIRSTLGVDVLQVDAGEGDSGPTVRTGKYLADGVFVGAKQGAGPGSSAATVEIELTPNISLESEVGQTGRSGAGVSWQFNY